jgi:hypothetical protein
MEVHVDEGRKEKNDVQGIGKTLLVVRLAGARGIQEPAVKGDLKFVRNLDSVRITVVEKQFAGSIPSGIEVR